MNLERYGYRERLELLGRDDRRVDFPRGSGRTSGTRADGGANSRTFAAAGDGPYGGTEADAARELLTTRAGLALRLKRLGLDRNHLVPYLDVGELDAQERLPLHLAPESWIPRYTPRCTLSMRRPYTSS